MLLPLIAAVIVGAVIMLIGVVLGVVVGDSSKLSITAKKEPTE